MAKKWGKRKRANSPIVVPQAVRPDALFGSPHSTRQAPPASSTPLADHLATEAPGVTENYVVLPRSLAQDMPLPWQHQLAALLAQFHDAHRELSWPTYRVVPSRPERLTDLDEEQLAEAGYLVEIDAEGELVYRDRSGRRVEDPEDTVALVPCLDPIVRRDPPAGDGGRDTPGPVPMNIGPQPVWRTTASPTSSSATSSPAASGSPAEGAVSTPSSAPILPVPTTADYTAVGVTPASGTRPMSGDESEAVDSAPASSSLSPVTLAGAGADDRGWFDDLADDPVGVPPTSAGTEDAEPGSEPDAAVEFGPTGDEPTEIRYRYRG